MIACELDVIHGSRVVEWQLQSWNDSAIIPHFRSIGTEWERNDGTSLADGMGMTRNPETL